jgi:hypothetical protein
MMKINKTSITAYMAEEKKEYANKSTGKPMRQATVADTLGQGKPTRTNPMGFMSMQCFSGSPDQKKSPTSKPGNAGGKRII